MWNNNDVFLKLINNTLVRPIMEYGNTIAMRSIYSFVG